MTQSDNTFSGKLKAVLERIRGVFPITGPLYQGMRNLPRYPGFFKQFFEFRKAGRGGRFTVRWKDLYPCLGDKTAQTPFDRHYVFHTAWAARIIAKTRPAEHVDISSSVYFIALVSAFVKVKAYDFRPPRLDFEGMETGAADLMKLPFADNSVNSLSCMHVIEHVGLGRYGDKLDSDGDLEAIAELKRALARGGNLLFVVPVGKEAKVMFNGHRIYRYEQIMSYFEGFELMDFSLVPDDKNAGFFQHATKEMADEQNFGCGCFWFRKKEQG